jgi:hypothetical protein
MPFGVLIAAYSMDTHTRKRLLFEAHSAARSLKEVDPDVPTALVTHDSHRISEEASFDYLVPVREDLLLRGRIREGNYAPQWFTRLYFYASSPFNVTVAVDSNSGFCGSVRPLLQAARFYHFAVPSQTRGCGFHPHNFMMVFASETREAQALFEEWTLRQLQKGVPSDDQGPLGRALRRRFARLRPRYGVVNPNAALSLINLQLGVFLPSVTAPLVGPPMVVHPFNAFHQCAEWRAATGGGAHQRPLIVVGHVQRSSNGERLRLTPAYSPAECANISQRTCVPGCWHRREALYETQFTDLVKTSLISPMNKLSSSPRADPRTSSSLAARFSWLGCGAGGLCRLLGPRSGEDIVLLFLLLWSIVAWGVACSLIASPYVRGGRGRAQSDGYSLLGTQE